MSATPHTPVPSGLDAPLPMTLPRLAEKKRLGEPIVMVTAYDYPSAQVAQAAGRRRRARRRLGRDDRARLPLDGPGLDRRDADARLGRAARAAHAAARRRPAVRLLRGLGRAGDRHRPAIRQGGRLRCGEARARRDQRPARARDRRGRDPGDGSRRASPRRPPPPSAAIGRRAGPPSRRSRWPATRSRWRRPAVSRSCWRRFRPLWPRRSSGGSRSR